MVPYFLVKLQVIEDFFSSFGVLSCIQQKLTDLSKKEYHWKVTVGKVREQGLEDRQQRSR